MNCRSRLLRYSVLVVALAAAGCARPSAPAAMPRMAVGEAAFLATFVAHTGAPLLGGNRVDVLLNGAEIFPALLDGIRDAKTTITYAQYSYGDGLVAREIATALAARARAGVDVRILLDAIGTLRMPRAYVEEMRNAGCRVVYFRPINPLRPLSVNYRNHRRVLVVDGHTGFTGGAGVSRKWMGDGRTERHWRDTDVRVEGPVVQYLQAAFAESWLEATGQLLTGDGHFPVLTARGHAAAQIVASSPRSARHAMYRMYLLAIASAQRFVYITNPYFVPDDALIAELIRAVDRGVRVVMLLPGSIDHTIVRHVSRAFFPRLLHGGIEIHEYQPALLHAKTMVIDAMWATVGSANLMNRSFAMDDEINIVIHDPHVAGRLERIFLDDLKHARQVDLELVRSDARIRFFGILARPIRALGIL